MAEGVKHVIFAKFKDGLSAEQIDGVIKAFAKLEHLIPTMKSFRWGTDIGRVTITQGNTHVFEAGFDDVEGYDAYLVHPAHNEFAVLFQDTTDQMIALDYLPQPYKL